MNYFKCCIFLSWLFSCCLCEVTEEKKAKLLSDFINYYNLRPNVGIRASDGFLQSVHEIDENTYRIEVSFTAHQDDSTKMMKCSAAVEDLDERGIAIVNNVLDCHELKQERTEDSNNGLESVEVQAERGPISLENEVQSDPGITSGEQFIAIPRPQSSAPCIGCASHVNPQAQGVQDLAALGIRHLDIHEPTVRHSLDSVIDVERQVQVVNGIRYILKLSVNFDNCTETKSDLCYSTKTCKISILVKPWQTLPNGAKYRAILSNNCTEQWLFGENGEVLPETTENKNPNNLDRHSTTDDDIHVEHREDVQSQPNVDKTLTVDELKALEEQILPLDKATDSSSRNIDTVLPKNSEAHVANNTTDLQYSAISLSSSPSESNTQESSNLSDDKRKAIDDMLDFFKFSGYKSQSPPQNDETMPRLKRSYDYDLKLLSLTDDYRQLKQSMENAKYIYEMAQAMVDHLNEADLEIKNRVIKNVVKAEEEEANEKHFVYIQVQILIPCDSLNCDPKETQTKICNGVLDSTNKKKPQIMYSFCYSDSKEKEILEKVKDIESDDPVLLRLSKAVLKKMEGESAEPNAMKIKKIISANTRVSSGRLTKISLIVDYMNCSKSVPLILRKKCSTVDNLGSRICEVLVHERDWLKERAITYTCTERPIDMIISKDNPNKNITIDDPKIAEILQDALQYLELQSSSKNKLQITNVIKISTQVLAGFLIKIQFVVGNTNCSNNGLKYQSDKCVLLNNERLRKCKAQVWDRSWIVDGRQMEVICDEDVKVTETARSTKSKREISSGDTIIGRLEVKNPNDPTYRQLAKESLQKYVTSSGNKGPHRVVNIEKVTTQVVSGSLTRITFTAAPTDNSQSDVLRCISKVWEQSWLNKKDIDVSCEINSYRSKRHVKAGGEVVQNPTNPKYWQLAEESLQKYVKSSGIKGSHSVVLVEKVTTQVVAGSLTRITFTAAPTSDAGDVLRCVSKVWEHSWLSKKYIDVSCEIDSYRSKRQLGNGGEVVQNPNDPAYQQLAEDSLQKYVTSSGSKGPHRVVNIEKVTTQVVSGSLTRITFTAAPTENTQGDALRCVSKVWEQSWLNKKDIDVSCEIDSHRSKRQVKGGEVVQNPNDPAYQQLAEESLQKYVTSSGDKGPHKVVNIEKVTTQVVSGSLTRITFTAAPTDNNQGNVLRCVTKVWEQPWLNKKDIEVSCEIESHRSKRHLKPGGEVVQNPNDPAYQQLAEESLQKYVTSSGNKAPHRVVNIEKVTTQVVSGSLTQITFTAAPADNTRGDVLRCVSKVWEQPWLNKKDIEVSCDIESQRPKRHLVVGGEMLQNPNDPAYQHLAEESLQKYVTSSGNKAPHRVVNIEKVTTQVVSGSLTQIIFTAAPTDNTRGDVLSCISKVWEQPWLNKKDIEVSCEIESHRPKRHLKAGGEVVQNPNDPAYQQLAEESLQKYVTSSGNQAPHRVVNIEKVTTQVVSGSLTKITFTAAPTDNTQGDVLRCVSKVWEQSWLNKKDIDVSCEIDSHRSKRHVIGGEVVQNPNDPAYQQLAEESLQKYVTSSGNKAPHRVVNIEKVTTQVVSGSLTQITFTAAPADNTRGDVLRCVSKVWEQPWLNKKDIEVSCDIESQRSKRQLVVGGEKLQNPNDPAYQQLAEESLQKYVTSNGNKAPHRVVYIEKVTTQVVSGSLTQIIFTAAPTDNTRGDVLRCVSKVWEQPWLNKKDIEVSCDIESQRSKRQLVVGGEMLQNPNDPAYQQLAEESLQKYVTSNGNKAPHRVVNIEKVTTQVVSGSLTQITFTAAPTYNTRGDVLRCVTKVWEQPWLNKNDIEVSCEIDSHRSKRHLKPGGEVVQNPNDPAYQHLAEESLQKYVTSSGNKAPHRVVNIEKVTTQVVSGSLTQITFTAAPADNTRGDVLRCVSKVWEQPWLNKKDIEVSCDIEIQRSKRQLVVGGEKLQNPNDPAYQQLAEESLQKYVTSNGNKAPHRVVNIEKVTTQVVSGSLTQIIFTAAPTDNTRGDVLRCVSKVWEQPWLNKKDIEVSCEIDSQRSKRHLKPGGEVVQNPNDPAYQQLAEESLQKYVTSSGNQAPHRVVNIEKVTTQVVSGSLTQITFTAAPTDNTRGDVLRCVSKVWEQPWLNKKDIEVSCDIESQRPKRHLVVGGEMLQNPNDPAYQHLAEESLQKYVTSSGNKAPHRVVNIEKVTTQVVSGSLTQITFTAAPADNTQGDVLRCVSKVWEQPWLNKKDIEVSCDIESQRSKRQLVVGGEKLQNPNDPAYQQLAEESLQKYVTSNGNKAPHRVVYIEKVTTQVVSGSLTQIIFTAAPTDNTRGDVLRCVSKVWEQPWLNKKDIEVSCDIESRRSKRQLVVGGEMLQNPNDPAYQQLAEESLQKYVTSNGNKAPHRVVNIEKVTTQVVSGSLTQITFTAAPTYNTRGDVLRCVTKVWEQPWLNKNDIEVSCEIDSHRSKRHLKPGGEVVQNPNDPAYQHLAEESLQKYVTSSGNKAPHRVVNIEKVTTQVVSGSLTQITFTAAPADNTRGDVLRCVSKVWEQPWLNKKDIEVSCDIESQRSKRQLVVGGEKLQNPNDPAYQQLAEESLQKYVTSNGNKAPHRVVNIEKVTTQVVSGSLTQIIFTAAPTDNTRGDVLRCVSKVWEQPWLNKKDIEVSCDIESQRSKRQLVVGGEMLQNPNDPAYQQLAEESLQKYVTSNGNKAPHRVVNIEKVTTQVVSGSLTQITFTAAPTYNTRGDVLRCVTKVWEQPWLNKNDIEVSCEIDSHRSKRHLKPGGEVVQNPNDPAYQHLAEESLQKYVTSSGNKAPHRVVNIEKVTTQVVSGSLTQITFTAAPADNTRGDVLRCVSKVWEQPWLNKKDIEVSCDIESQRSKRQLVVGGEKLQNPNDPAYQQLAEESLQKYVTSNGNKAPHRVVNIEKVTTQVVSGSLTQIIFTAAPTDNTRGDVLRCVSKVWEQPWLNKKDIEVSCEIDSQRSKRHLKPGGEVVQNPNDPAYQQLAEESLQKYVTSSGNQAPHRVVNIEKVTTQVVSGSLTQITFTAAPTDNTRGDVLRCVSKVWEQPWLNKKDIEVSCDIDSHRSKRHLKPGGEVVQNPNDPAYQQLAEESLQKYVTSSGNKAPHRVVNIEKVTTQVVSGSLTQITFTAAPADNTRGDVLRCVSKVWEQPWLNKKDIEVSCDIESQRPKRHLVVGGEMLQNPNDPAYQHLAEESLQKYVTSSGNKAPHRVVNIEKVTTQVVSGSLTQIIFTAAPTDNTRGDVLSCISKVWEQPWLNKKDIEVSCEIESHRPKRHLKAGGEVVQNPNDPAYQQLAEESLQKYVTSSGNQAPHRVVNIEKVTTQVVSGSLTKITFTAAPTDNTQGDVLRCVSKVWEQSWLNKKDIDVSCEIDSHRSKRHVIGGEVVQNPNDPAYQQLAEESLQKYVTSSGNKAQHRVVNIEKVTTQVVSGSLTKITFTAAPTDNTRGDVLRCVSKVWEQPWLNKKDIEVFCEIDSQRSKRHLKPGGEVVQNSNDPAYQQLAEESLQKYVTSSGNQAPHRVVNIEEVTTQVVSGTLTRITFTAAPTDNTQGDVLRCVSKVWEQSWMNKKDIDVSCEIESHRLKRQVIGGEVVQNPNDPAIFLQWADKSLQKYLSDTRNKNPYRIDRIEQATFLNDLTKIIFVAFSTANHSDLLICVTQISNEPSLILKKVSVICENNDPGNEMDFKKEIEYNKNQYFNHKNIETEEDVSKPTFQLLAVQSLSKFSKSVGVYHKLLSVDQVSKTSGEQQVIYQIKFSASPTDCSSDVSNMNALTCKLVIDNTVYCKAEIWKQLRLSERKINVKCALPEDYLDLFKSEEEKIHYTEANFPKPDKSEVRDLVLKAVEMYLSLTKSKYAHKITGIYGLNEQFANDIIDFSISPTKCLRHDLNETIENCPFVQPRLNYDCKAKMKRNALLGSENDMTVTCKEVKIPKSKTKNRAKRQIDTEHIDDIDNEIDEDTMYYYAKRAVGQVNTNPSNNNMFKLVTIHAVKTTVQMKAIVVKMYIEVAETYCVRYQTDVNIENCEEMEGLNHKLCLARIYPSPGDELVIRHVHVVCDDDEREFNALTGLHTFELLRLSIEELERKPEIHHKLVHQGEPQLIPTLESKSPFKLNFIIAYTNCSKTVDLDKNPYQCFLDSSIPSKSCSSFIWLETATRTIKYINVDCNSEIPRQKRSSLKTSNIINDGVDIKEMVNAALEKLEIASLHRYKQRVLHINSHSSKITTGKVTTIDFDVAYTSCIKYEWVQNITSCDIIDHLPRRHCVAQIWERLWLNNGRHINVTCEDDETPLEAHIEFESAEMAMQLAKEALKHIEAKYPHPLKQKIVRIFSLEKQIVAGIHYKMKVEVGFTHCLALSDEDNCTLDTKQNLNRFCRINVWVRPWTDHPPNFRVQCDFQESTTSEHYHRLQAEYLFYNFVAIYNPSYANDHSEFERRFEIFKENIKKIHELNVHEKGTALYGVTRFTDLTYKEFSSRYTGLNIDLRNNSEILMKHGDIPDVKLPQSFDWRAFDTVTEVKDQGSCGSGWAFSVTGNIEGQWKMQSGELVALSEQQLLDCDEVNKGCDGGLPMNAYSVIEEQGGLEGESNYPYEAESEKCLFNKTLAKVRISGAVNITTNETDMAKWLLQNGPISIGINANAMQFYLNGISHPWTTYCSPDKIDHAALIVGYGETEYRAFHKKIPYWIVKNSWGKSWGEGGYYRVHRGDGTCGLNRMATSAII